MEFRSTNDNGYVHFQGDLVSNVSSGQAINSSHGVHLTGGSTGGIVQAAGDETNIALTVRSKGDAPLNLNARGGAISLSGSSGSTLSLGGGSTGQITLGSTNSTVFIGGSTVPFSGFIRFQDTAVATPNFATTNIMVMETTHAITGVSTAIVSGSPYFVIANPVNTSTDCVLVGASLDSSNAGVHCRWLKASTLAVGASTATVNFLIIRM